MILLVKWLDSSSIVLHDIQSELKLNIKKDRMEPSVIFCTNISLLSNTCVGSGVC